MRTSGRVAIAFACAAGCLLVPASFAQAATLTAIDEQCYASDDKVPIEGSGFAPSALVTVTVEDGAQVRRNATSGGYLRTQIKAPRLTGRAIGPRTFSITATDGTNTTSPISLYVTRDRPVSNAPVSGNPNAVTTWEFASFEPDRFIFGHFRLKGRTIGTVRFGRAGAAPCGYLRTRARRVPVRPLRAGRWTLQIDQARRYLRTRKPRYVVEFSIMRSPQLGR